MVEEAVDKDLSKDLPPLVVWKETFSIGIRPLLGSSYPQAGSPAEGIFYYIVECPQRKVLISL